MAQQFLQDARDIIRGATAFFAGAMGRLSARILLMLLAGNFFGVAALGRLGETAALLEISAALGILGLKRALLGVMANNERDGIPVNQALTDAFALTLVSGGIICLLLTALWSVIYGETTYLPRILALTVLGIIITEVALTATRHRRIVRWVVFSQSIVNPWSFLGLAILAYFLDSGPGGLIWAYAGSVALTTMVALMGFFRVFGWRGMFGQMPSFAGAWKLARISAPTGIAEIGAMMFRRIDILVLGIVAGPQLTGIYYMGQQISTVVHRIYDLFEPIVAPVIAQAWDRGGVKSVEQQLSRTCRWIFTLQLGLLVPLAVFGDRVLGLFGDGFAVGAAAMIVLFLGEIADGSFALVELPLVFRRPKVTPILILAALALEIAGVYLLGSLYGPIGAAAAFAGTMVALSLARLVVVRKLLNISVLNSRFLPALSIAAVGWLLINGLDRVIGLHSGGAFGAAILASILFHIFLVRRFALSRDDRDLFRSLRKMT